MDQVDVDGLTVAYERAGSGRPLVLLNGYVGDGAGTWRAQLDALSDEFTVVAWDAPGSGRSSDPPASFGIAGYADCAAGFVDALGLDGPHVAGMSFGGTVALALEHRHPGRAASLVLAGAYAGWAGSLEPDEVRRRLQQALDLADSPPEQVAEALATTMFSAAVADEAREAFAAAVAGFHPDGLRVMARAVADADLRDALPDVGVPTLLLAGGRDVRAPLAVAEAMHAAIPGSELVVLPGVGHVSCVEAPGPFNDAVRTFLRRVDGTDTAA